MQGVFVLLVALSLAATLLGGFAKAPWWFWLVGAAALALLIATDPNRFRASYADTRASLLAFPAARRSEDPVDGQRHVGGAHSCSRQRNVLSPAALERSFRWSTGASIQGTISL
jgi:Zn-dependent protease with chaperone function